MRPAGRDIGFPTPASPSSFPTGPAVLTGRRPRLVCTNRFILLDCRASSESFRLFARPRPFETQAPSLGLLLPHRDMNRQRRCSGPPRSRRLPSSAFLTPPTVSSATGLVGLFHPTATSRVHQKGAVSRAQPVRLIDVPCPLVVDRAFLPAVAHRRQNSRPRPQGLHPCESPLLKTLGFSHRPSPIPP